MPFLNGLKVNHLVLEFARRGYDELEAFKDLDPKIGLGLGVVDIKDNLIEVAPKLIARRLEHAAEKCHRTPAASPTSIPTAASGCSSARVADGKMRSLVKGRDLYLKEAAN
jgi:5-methyltetrahydropteroyltriglutamate--homocysteine methyltransferase